MDKIYRARRKRARHIRTNSSRVFHQRLGVFFTFVLFATVLGVMSIALTTVLVYRSYAHDFKSPQDQINSRFVGPSFAYDRNGQQLGEYIDPNEGLRDPLAIEEISPYVIAATVATEDASFYDNPGVNFKGLARAAWENLTPFGDGGFFGGSGGSSITQQLVKNVYIPEALTDRDESNTDKVNRKLKESVLALEMKRNYEDDQIMTWYLNQIGYGRRAYGIGAAAEQFFGKSAAELTLGEAAYLTGLPQRPGYFYEHPDEALLRQHDVLDLMIRHIDEVNKIPTKGDDTKPLVSLTVEQIEAAKAEPLAFVDTATFDTQAPHFFYFLKDQVTKMCQADLFSAPGDIPCDEVVEQGGLSITSTIDLGLNAVTQGIVEENLAAFEAGTNGHNAAVVTIRPSTGEILAYVGSRNFYDQNPCNYETGEILGCQIAGQVDIASSEQSLGSSMKTFTYLEAFESGWVPSTHIDDKELIIDPGSPSAHKVNNWNSSYLGTITIRKAMSESVNTSAVRTLMEVGEDNMRDMAHRLGITDLRQGTCGPTITLGACEVKLVDQTFAYGVIANNGVMYGRPTSEDLPSGFRDLDQVSVLKITDNDGNVLYSFDKPEARNIVDPAYAYMVTDVLSKDAITWSRLTIDRPAATKTGTSEEFRDGVIMGYTPDLVTGVWMGNANNEPMAPGTFSAQGVGPIWREVMTEAHAYLQIPAHEFTRPDNVITQACGGRNEVFKVNTPTVKNGACRGPSNQPGISSTPTPRGPLFPTRTDLPSVTPAPVETATATPEPPAITYYKTQEGDTVQSVANKFRVKATDLARANGITLDTPLEPGTVLVIPLGAQLPVEPTPTAAPEEPPPEEEEG